MIAPVKRTVKYLIAIILYYSGLLASYSFLRKISFKRSNFTILMYHRVLEENDEEKEYVQPGLYVSRLVFEKQIAFLSKKYNLLSLGRLTEFLEEKQSPPSKSIAITFDDGWEDNYLFAYPILRKYNVPATIFLTTDFIDSDNTFWFSEISMILAQQKIIPERLSGILKKVLEDDKYISSFQYFDSEEPGSNFIDSDKLIEDLKQFDHEAIMKIIAELNKESGVSCERFTGKRQTLTWEEVIEMNNNGIDFGSHGCSHRIMPGLTDAEIERELIESKRIIEGKLSREINLFSYPNGDYCNHIREMVLNCGYVCALATKGKKESEPDTNLYSLKRISVHEGVSVGPMGKFSRAMFDFHILRNS